MIHIRDFMTDDQIFVALDSKIRRSILKILIEDGSKNLDQLAKILGVTNGALTTHIRLLEKVGLIKTQFNAARHGLSKECIINTDRIIVDLLPIEKSMGKIKEIDIKIGTYSDFFVTPTCGIVTATDVLGRFDEPQFFTYPERSKAAALWFSTGYVEYIIPNLLNEDEELTELQFIFEMASEAPGFAENFPSDIYFWINEKCLGTWTIPGERNNRRGLFTPNWWDRTLGQYGLIYVLSINKKGAFLNGYDLITVKKDGKVFGETTLADLDISAKTMIKLKFAAPPDTENRGGLTLFGKGFGDYNRGITCKFCVSPQAQNSNVVESSDKSQ